MMRTRSFRGANALAALALLTGGLLAAGGGTSAAASPGDCANWWSADGATNARAARAMVIPGGRYDTLMYGNINGIQHAWSQYDGNTRTGEHGWMDVSWDGGRTWLQCGPFRVEYDGQTVRSKAFRTSNDPKVKVRSCDDADGSIACTSWW